jgi:hypothetical protein
MFHIYVVSVCSMFHLFQMYIALKCFMLFGESGGAGSDGGIALASGNGEWRAEDRRTWHADGGGSNRGRWGGLRVRDESSGHAGASMGGVRVWGWSN